MQKLLERTTTVVTERWLVEPATPDGQPTQQDQVGEAPLGDAPPPVAAATPGTPTTTTGGKAPAVAPDTAPEPEHAARADEDDDCECVPVRRRR